MAWEYAAGHALYHLLIFLLISSHAVFINIEPYVVIIRETWRIYSCQVVSTFAALIFTTGRVTTEWGMSPTLRDADDSGTHGLKDYTDVL